MATAIAGMDRAAVERMVAQLATVKENLRHAIARRHAAPADDSLPNQRPAVSR